MHFQNQKQRRKSRRSSHLLFAIVQLKREYEPQKVRHRMGPEHGAKNSGFGDEAGQSARRLGLRPVPGRGDGIKEPVQHGASAGRHNRRLPARLRRRDVRDKRFHPELKPGPNLLVGRRQHRPEGLLEGLLELLVEPPGLGHHAAVVGGRGEEQGRGDGGRGDHCPCEGVEEGESAGGRAGAGREKEEKLECTMHRKWKMAKYWAHYDWCLHAAVMIISDPPDNF